MLEGEVICKKEDKDKLFSLVKEMKQILNNENIIFRDL